MNHNNASMNMSSMLLAVFVVTLSLGTRLQAVDLPPELPLWEKPPGDYVFQVIASDGHCQTARDVRVKAFDGNQPPMPLDVHNRLPVVVTLPQDTTELRAGALDLEGDDLTFQWHVGSRPPGSAVRLESPGQASCRATNVTAAGDHVFRLDVSDGTTTVSETLTVPVHPTREQDNGGRRR
jgi:hypothetical protein